MKKIDKEMIKTFLEQNYDAFQDHLDQNDIEPTEAELIIDSLSTLTTD